MPCRPFSCCHGADRHSHGSTMALAVVAAAGAGTGAVVTGAVVTGKGKGKGAVVMVGGGAVVMDVAGSSSLLGLRDLKRCRRCGCTSFGSGT